MRARLIHPTLDPWFLGGIPLLAILVCLVLPESLRQPLSPTLSITLLLFSYPHFAASYAAFYGQGRIWRKHAIAACGVPLTLGAGLAWLLITGRQDQLMTLAQVTLFLLYWHYLKQAYGSCIWLGTLWDHEGTRLPRRLLLISCLVVGSLGFLTAQGADGHRLIFGLYLPYLPMPGEVQQLVRGLALFAVLSSCLWLLVVMPGSRFRWRAGLSLLPLLALWCWFEPAFQNPLTFALLPALHGLQYLPFPLRVLWKRPSTFAERRSLFAGLCIVLILVGAAAFMLLPRELARIDVEGLASAWLIFLNLHHYAIDASMWRLGRAEVRESLQIEPCRTSSVE